MLLHDLRKPPHEAFVCLRLLLQHFTCKDHVVFVGFQHIRHPVVCCGTYRGHRRLRLLVRFHTNLVDLVSHVLLLRGLQGL